MLKIIRKISFSVLLNIWIFPPNNWWQNRQNWKFAWKLKWDIFFRFSYTVSWVEFPVDNIGLFNVKWQSWLTLMIVAIFEFSRQQSHVFQVSRFLARKFKILISNSVYFLYQKMASRHIDECIYVISKNEYFVVWGLYQVYIRNIKVLTSFIRLKGKSSTLASQRKIDYVQQRKMHLLYHFSSCYAQDHSVLKSAKNSSFKF